jgi:hypothetical protein
VLLDACAKSNSTHCTNSVTGLMHRDWTCSSGQIGDASATRAHNLLLAAEVAQVHVACCRYYMVAAHASSSTATCIGALLPLPVHISVLHHPAALGLQRTPTLAPAQRAQLLASASALSLYLICRLSCSVFRTAPSSTNARARRLLLMRACNARLPYLIARLQSPAVAAAATNAARAVARAASVVQAAAVEQRLQGRRHSKKKRARAPQSRTPPK